MKEFVESEKVTNRARHQGFFCPVEFTEGENPAIERLVVRLPQKLRPRDLLIIRNFLGEFCKDKGIWIPDVPDWMIINGKPGETKIPMVDGEYVYGFEFHAITRKHVDHEFYDKPYLLPGCLDSCKAFLRGLRYGAASIKAT